MTDVAVRAELLAEAGRHGEAISLLEQGLAVEPEDEELLETLARVQLDVDAGAALAAAERLHAVAPENPNASLVAAWSSWRLGRKGAARRHAEEAVRLAPWSAAAHAALGQAEVGRRFRYRRAREAAERAVELAPESTVGYVTAGNVELGRGRWRRASRWYRRALDVDPDDATAQANLAIADRAGGRLGGAFDNALAVLRVDPADAHARAVLDDTIATTISHLLWIVLALCVVVGIVVGTP